MKFACTQENLIQGLTLVSHVTGKNVHLPILSNVLLKTEAGSLKISATNLEIAINATVRGKVEVEGEYSVPAKLFLDYVSLIPSGKVELIVTDEGLEVKAGEQETILKGMSASEFPLLPKLAKDIGYQLSFELIRKALSQVVFAVSTSQSRPELSGVYCYFGNIYGQNQAVFAATDSYRLAEKLVPFSGSDIETKYIVPAKAFVEVSRILGSYKDELGAPEKAIFHFTDNQFVMSFGNVELISRLIEGSFPDYRQIIPTSYKTEAVLLRSELQKAVRTASLFSKQGLFDVYVLLDPSTGLCTVQSADQGMGKTKSAIKGIITGDKNEVTLNYKYLGDGLSAITTEKVRIKQIDGTNPLLLLPEGDSEQYQYIIMPIRK